MGKRKSISNAHASQKEKTNSGRGKEKKFDIESNAINLGFAIQSTLASLYFM